jgi:hypothetical protein
MFIKIVYRTKVVHSRMNKITKLRFFITIMDQPASAGMLREKKMEAKHAG